MIHNDFPSAEAAQGFANDPSLPEAMERAGVTGEPSISLATLAERKTYTERRSPRHLRRPLPGARLRRVEAGLRRARGLRRQHGAIEHRIWRIVEDPNYLAIHLDFPSEADGEAFVADPA